LKVDLQTAIRQLAARVQNLGHPSNFTPKTRAILRLMRLNFLSV
jgi:hypothetical protein